MSEGQEGPKPQWNNTIRGLHRVQSAHPEAQRGLFAGRRIIGRDTPINGGVYIGGGAREAIVVDDKQYPKELQQSYKQLRTNMERGNGSGKTIFDYVYEVSKANLGGSLRSEDVEKQVDEAVVHIMRVRGADAQVPLNFFIQKGIGICRQRALLAGYLIERLIREGRLKGRVSVDRNTIPGQGGHAWARYESPDRKIIVVIDPSIGYVGPINKAPGDWSYERPPG